ncbi:MAG: hypothetical protein FJ104_11250 [Deltaproteobacteria bacterium]|nr:hypothetical protein [Deltaproteobacteria bacterium]
MAAALAALSFVNLGQAQFFRAADGAPTYVHPYDLRVYHPTARYFAELGFDGVYEGSVAALVELAPDLDLARLADVPLRDLRTHAIVRVRDLGDRIERFRNRFSPARWKAFVADMRYFHATLGTHGYLASLLDHGGNATPVWLAVARAAFGWLPASDPAFLATAALDLVLLGAAYFSVFRAYGATTALVSLVVFGANDFYMGGGTNWVGATLRHDWLAALLFAAAALARDRHLLGGALVGVAACLRAFPGLALLGVAALGLTELLRPTSAPPGRRLEAARPALAVGLGAAGAAAAAVVVSAVLLGVESWPAWLHKVSLLSRDPHPNHVGLRALLSFDPAASDRVAAETAAAIDWQAAQLTAFAGRQALFLGGGALLTAALLVGCRGPRLDRAMILGFLLVPVWLYPANYYLHAICLAPLLAGRVDGRPGAAATTVLAVPLALAAAQLASYATSYLDEHYFIASALLIAALPVLALVRPGTAASPVTGA